MDFTKLTNNELIKFCANNPENRSSWREFCKRFDETIWSVVYRSCSEKNISPQSDQFKQIVRDLVQDVYVKLVEKDCEALKKYVGRTENAFYTYLAIICKNEVINYIIKMTAKKRFQSLIPLDDDRIGSIIETGRPDDPADCFNNQSNLNNLKQNIEIILNKYISGRNKERDKLIFKLYFYEGFSPPEIVAKFYPDLSSKRVNNILTKIKQLLKKKLISPVDDGGGFYMI